MSISLQLISFFLFSVAFPSCFSADPQYEDCLSPLRCGYGSSVFPNITYPFWGDNIGRPKFCGQPTFELTCTEKQNLTIAIEDFTLRVVSTNLHNKTITVADESLLEGGCPKMLNFKGDDRFTLNPNTETIDIFNCSSSDPIQALSNITCGERIMETVTYHFFGSFNFSQNCSKAGEIPISASAKNVLLHYSGSNLKTALEEGFELRYNINDTVCQGCSTSNGICGSESHSGSFRCLCSDRPHNLSCNDDKG